MDMVTWPNFFTSWEAAERHRCARECVPDSNNTTREGARSADWSLLHVVGIGLADLVVAVNLYAVQDTLSLGLGLQVVLARHHGGLLEVGELLRRHLVLA